METRTIGWTPTLLISLTKNGTVNLASWLKLFVHPKPIDKYCLGNDSVSNMIKRA